MNLRKDQRKQKRLVNWYRKHAGWGKYVIDCRGHPCKVVEVEFYTHDPYGNGCMVKSKLDGAVGSCSYLHCRPQPITYQQYMRITEPVL